MSMKNSNDTIGNRNRDLSTCSAVPQRTELRPASFTSPFVGPNTLFDPFFSDTFEICKLKDSTVNHPKDKAELCLGLFHTLCSTPAPACDAHSINLILYVLMT